MAKIHNENRTVNAYLKSKSGINAPGVYYAVKENADGFNVVSISSLPSVELFIGQGTSYQDDITEWTLFNSQAQYGGIGANAFARFQNLESVTIWQEDTDNLLLIDDNAFYSNVELAHIYVHPDLLARYQTTYSGKSFVSLFEAYELITDLVVPTSFNGEIAPTTLTKAWLDLVFANMPAIERNAKTTVIVPSYFTGIDVGAFSGLGTRFIYLQELKCNGTKTFASGFLNGANWCKHLWLDNGSSTLASPYCTDDTVIYANFRVVAPYLVFANYFMQEHNIKTGVVCPIVGYNQFSSGASLPQQSPTGEYLWFSNIDFDSDYDSPTGLENDDSYVSSYVASTSGYYYCYDKTEILVIQDDGTHVLTSALVESAIQGIDTPLEWINTVKVPTTFTDFVDKCLDVITLTGLTLETKGYSQDETHILHSDFLSGSTRANHFNKVIFTDDLPIKTTSTVIYFPDVELYAYAHNTTSRQMNFSGFYAPNITTFDTNKFLYSNFGAINMPNIVSFTANRGIFCSNIINLNKLETTDRNGFVETNVAIVKLPSIIQMQGFGNNQYLRKLFIGTTNCQLDTRLIQLGHDVNFQKIFIPATAVPYYKTATNWLDYSNKIVGVLDGANVYTNDGFSYPKLTGIDTEANIQLLTPADNSLYLASDTGNLWQYSNGGWSNLFGTDYSATWYSDEDCTTTVLPSAMDTTHTYYCKLTWNNPTLTIEPQSGETTLTSAIVSREIAKASSNPSVVTKIVIPAGFTSIENGALDVIDSYNDLTNLTLETNQRCSCSVYANMTTASNKFTTWNYKYNSSWAYAFENVYINTLRFTENISVDYGAPLFGAQGYGDAKCHITNLIFEENTTSIPYLYNNGGITNLYLMKIESISGYIFGNIWYDRPATNIYIYTDNAVLNQQYGLSTSNDQYKPTKIYIPRGSLSYYQNAANWSDYSSLFVEYDY